MHSNREIPLVCTFFDSVSEYAHFFLMLKEMRKATENFECTAVLTKEDGKYLYVLELEDGVWIGEYVRSFRPTQENVDLFNAGCGEMARRLRIVLDAQDMDQLPTSPPAFGILSCETPDDEAIQIEPAPRTTSSGKYFPPISRGRVVSHESADGYNIILMTDIQSNGPIEYIHVLIATKEGALSPVFVVAAERDQSSGPNSNSYFLCSYPGSGHVNHGSSEDWAAIPQFARKARSILREQLGIG